MKHDDTDDLKRFKTEIKEEDISNTNNFEILSEIELGKYECLVSNEEEDAADALAPIKSELIEESDTSLRIKSDIELPKFVCLPSSADCKMGHPEEESMQMEVANSSADFGLSPPQRQEHNRSSNVPDDVTLGRKNRSQSRQKGATQDGGQSLDTASGLGTKRGQSSRCEGRTRQCPGRLGGMTKHTLTRNREKCHKCSVCQERFTKADHLKTHLLMHSGENPHQCTVCMSRFNSFSQLKTHMYSHRDERPHQCSVCSSRFTEAYKLKKHLIIHTDEKPYHCQVCQFKANTSRNLKRHQLTHTGLKPYKCTYCEYSTSRHCELKRHIPLHTGVRLSCTECPSRFTDARSLKRHVMLSHRKSKTYVCALCLASFRESWRLKTHLIVHSDVKPFECDLCSYKCKILKYLENHRRRRHESGNEYRCAHCEYRAVARYNLVRHIRKMHK